LDFCINHDINDFVSTYHLDVKQYILLDNSLIMEGHAALNESYGKRFMPSQMNARLMNRMIIGNKVIDHEQVSSIDCEGTTADYVYEIIDGLIKSGSLIH
jgi:Uncharacterized conserved protein